MVQIDRNLPKGISNFTSSTALIHLGRLGYKTVYGVGFDLHKGNANHASSLDRYYGKEVPANYRGEIINCNNRAAEGINFVIED